MNSFESILYRAVCQSFDVSLIELLGEGRRQDVADARFAGMLLASKFTGGFHRKIAALFHRKEHGTSIHGIRRAKQLIEIDPVFRREYQMAFDFIQKQTQQKAA